MARSYSRSFILVGSAAAAVTVGAAAYFYNRRSQDGDGKCYDHAETREEQPSVKTQRANTLADVSPIPTKDVEEKVTEETREEQPSVNTQTATTTLPDVSPMPTKDVEEKVAEVDDIVEEAKVVVEQEEMKIDPEDDESFVEYSSLIKETEDENVVDYSSPIKAHVLVSGHPIQKPPVVSVGGSDAPSVAATEASVLTEDDDDLLPSIMTPPRVSVPATQKPSWFNPISEVDELESEADVFVQRMLFG